MSLITEDELGGRSVSSVGSEYEVVLVRVEAGVIKTKREEVH